MPLLHGTLSTVPVSSTCSWLLRCDKMSMTIRTALSTTHPHVWRPAVPSSRGWSRSAARGMACVRPSSHHLAYHTHPALLPRAYSASPDPSTSSIPGLYILRGFLAAEERRAALASAVALSNQADRQAAESASPEKVSPAHNVNSQEKFQSLSLALAGGKTAVCEHFSNYATSVNGGHRLTYGLWGMPPPPQLSTTARPPSPPPPFHRSEALKSTTPSSTHHHHRCCRCSRRCDPFRQHYHHATLQVLPRHHP